MVLYKPGWSGVGLAVEINPTYQELYPITSLFIVHLSKTQPSWLTDRWAYNSINAS